MRSRYPVVLLGLSIAILAAGTYVRRSARAAKPNAPAPVDLERLQRLTAERRLRDLSAYLSEAASADARRLLSPAGLVWDAAVVLAPPLPSDRATMTAVASDGRPVALVRAASPSSVPFSVWKPVAESETAGGGHARPKAGDWLLAVNRGPSGDPVFAHGLFQGASKQSCGGFQYEAISLDASLSPALIGGGVFTLDGRFAGFVAECGGRPIAIAATTIADVLARPVSPADLLEQRHGYRVEDGVVTAVWDGTPAATAGLRPGDLIDGDVERPPAVERRGRTVRLDWPDGRGNSESSSGLTLDGATVRAVAPGSAAAAAGILPGDVLADPRALERAKGPAAVAIERNGRRLEVLVRP